MLNSLSKWDDAGIAATLSFGSTAEKCIIPTSEIAAIFAPDSGIHMVFDPQKSDGPHAMEEPVSDKKPSGDVKTEESKKTADPDENVIRVDFKRRDD